jgi:hypothetical protein
LLIWTVLAITNANIVARAALAILVQPQVQPLTFRLQTAADVLALL